MADNDEPIDFDEAMQTIEAFIKNLYDFFETGEMKKENRPFIDCYTYVCYHSMGLNINIGLFTSWLTTKTMLPNYTSIIRRPSETI